MESTEVYYNKANRIDDLAKAAKDRTFLIYKEFASNRITHSSTLYANRGTIYDKRYASERCYNVQNRRK